MGFLVLRMSRHEIAIHKRYPPQQDSYYCSSITCDLLTFCILTASFETAETMSILTTEQLREFADNIEMGFQCHYNYKSNLVLFIPKELDYEDEDMQEAWEYEIKTLQANPNSFIEIEAPESHDYFKIMQEFASSTFIDKTYQNQLFSILENRKPFAHFKNSIENSSYREDWLLFRNNWMQEWVKSLIELHKPENL